MAPQVGGCIACVPTSVQRRDRSPTPAEILPGHAGLDAVAGIVAAEGAAFSNAVGIGTTLARRYSPRLFACGSLRSDAATPSPSSPRTTKFSASRFGSSTRSTTRSRASREQRAQALDGQVAAEPAPRRGRPHPQADVGVAALVARARAAQMAPSGTSRVGPVRRGTGASPSHAGRPRTPAGGSAGAIGTIASPITTRWSIAADGTSAGQYTPICASPLGGPVMKNPG